MGEDLAFNRVATPANPLRCAVLLSGSGSGMQALVEYQQGRGAAHRTAVVISNRVDAGGVERAQHLSIPVEVLPHPTPSTEGGRVVHESQIMDVLETYDVEWVVLSGYMRLLSPHFLQRWEGRIVNIHPSLLPKFPGAHAHRDVLASDVEVTGCTVHLGDEGMDTGQILAQAMVPVLAGDTEALLTQRVKVEEHRLYPEVLTWIAAGHLHREGGPMNVGH